MAICQGTSIPNMDSIQLETKEYAYLTQRPFIPNMDSIRLKTKKLLMFHNVAIETELP